MRLGFTTLPNVWEEGPFEVRIADKHMAMGIGAASVIFNVEPNYFTALSIKESKMQSRPSANPLDGYFQIVSTTALQELRNRWTSSHFKDPIDHQTLVHHWGRAAMTTGFYNLLTEKFFASRGYLMNEFQLAARDKEAKTIFIDYAFNQGQYGGSAPIEQVLKTNPDLRLQCREVDDVLHQCLPNLNSGGQDHTEDVLEYCRALKTTNNVYEIEIGWIDIQSVLNDTILPFFTHLTDAQKTAALTRASNMFTCLKGSDESISFRYEFATLIKYVAEALPMSSPSI